MELKRFKTFENRGDGVEDDDVQPKQLEFDFDNKLTFKKPSIVKDYILCLPSGEIIQLDDANDLMELINKTLVDYTYSYRGTILNCYCAPDSMTNKIKDEVKEIKSKKPANDKHALISKEYSDVMSKVTMKKNIVGYIRSGPEEIRNSGRDGVDYYYIIIPDLEINTNFYRTILEDMIIVTRKMIEKYPQSIFSFTDRINRSGVKYYNIPFGS